jgi:hypothetical protein
LANGIALLSLSILLVSANGFAESSAPPNRQEALKSVVLECGGAAVIGSQAAPVIEEDGSDLLRGINTFFAFISSDGEPVTSKQPKEERSEAEQYGVWVQWGLMPLLTFVIGVVFGGGFGDWRGSRDRRPTHQSADTWGE